MTLSSTINRVSYSGNSSTTAFSFPYYFLKSADLVVISKVVSTGVETLKVLTTDYTVTGAGVAAGGTVTMLVAPPTGTKLTIFRSPSIIQEVDLVENDELPAESVEGALDLGQMVAQRISDRVDRAVRLTDGFAGTFDPTLPADLSDCADKIPLMDSLGEGFADVADWPQLTAVNDAAANAIAAAASQAAALASQTAAAASQAAALASQTAAQTAVNSAFWRDVLFLTFADSPLTVVDATHRGKLLCVDTSGGNVVISLPAIAGLNLTTAFTLGIKKTSGDGNTVTINRGSTDTIDGATSKVIGAANSGAVFIPDTDPAPDTWTTTEFGASAGNMTVDLFSGTGAQTVFTLGVDPGSENNTFVFIHGVYQQKNDYSIVGTSLTFSTAPVSGTNNIQVISGTTLSIGVPSDGSVSRVKLAQGAIAAGTISAVKTTTYSATASDDVVRVDSSGGAFTVSLPAAAGVPGKRLTFIKTNTTDNKVTIDPNSSETINGLATIGINAQYERVVLFCDGSNWLIESWDGFKDEIFITGEGATPYGTTDVRTRRLAAASVTTGSAITYAVNAANGSKFTINYPGIYKIWFWDRKSATGVYTGTSRNSSDPTMDILSLPDQEALSYDFLPVGAGAMHWTGQVNAGDVLRIQDNADTNGATVQKFRMQRIG